jgi:arylsulfatase A-like enzyme
MRSTPNTLFTYLALALTVCSITYLSFSAERPQPPNILIILPDQWRAQAFGFASDPNARTPNLDRLQRQSVWFINAVAAVPVCCPTRASIMTGQRATTHGIFLNDAPLFTNATTVAEVFHAAGYDTGYIGKWHLNGPERSGFIPSERHFGFDYWKVLECTHDYNHSFYYADGTPDLLKWEGYDANAQTHDAQQFLRAHANFHEPRTAAVSDSPVRVAPSRSKIHGPNTRSPNDEAAHKPFLLFLSWGPPHDPYDTAPARYREMFHPDQLKLRPNVPSKSEPQARKDLAGYYAHCAALDDCVGQLLTTLEETGLDRDTLVLFTSDHGDMLGSHGMYKKQKPFDESVRVPFLIRLPKTLGTTSRKLDAPINSEDIMPTLLGLCGVPIPKTVEGLDFSGYIRGKKDPSDGAALIACIAPFADWSHQRGGREFRGIRTTRYTYVRDLNDPWLLFDNKFDPYQLNNLVSSPRAAKQQADLEATLQRKLRLANDSFLPAGDYIRKWNYAVDSNGTIPYTR